MILSRTKIFNIFPGLIQDSSIVKILSSFCSRDRYNYIPNRDLWINRLCFDISPAKFRTQADKNREQICYYNRNERNKSFNSFLVVRKQTSQANKIIFSIVNVINKKK